MMRHCCVHFISNFKITPLYVAGKGIDVASLL